MSKTASLKLTAIVLTVTAAAALTGCAGVYRVDNRVESFARWLDGATPPVQATGIPVPPQAYRFERLPSRSTGAAAELQAMLEQEAQAVLAPLGWTAATNPTAAPWTVEVTAQGLRLPRAPWEDPWEGSRLGWMGHVQLGIGRGGDVMWSPGGLRSEWPYYQRQVSLVVREAASGRVAFETSAAHDGRWNSSPGLWRAMIGAALEGFPAPPKGTRQINIDVPR